MAMKKSQKLGNFLERAATAKKKDDRLNVKIIKASDLDPIKFLPTGIELYDAIVGGLPRGRFTLTFGGEGVGKTTKMLITMGNVLRNGGSVVYMEPEHRSDRSYMKRYVPLEELYITQASSLGACLDDLVTIAESNLADLIVVDSLAALAVKELRGKGTEGDHMALMARRLPQFFQFATEHVAESDTAVVFIHQKRDVLEMYSSELETYSGGNHLRHQVSYVENMRRASTGKDPDKGERFKDSDGSKNGFMCNIKCMKGTIGTIPEGKNFQLDFTRHHGIADVQSTVMFAIRSKVLEKAGPGQYQFKHDGKSYEQRGLANVIVDVEKDKNLRAKILEKCALYVQEDPAGVVDVAPDEQFEASQTGKTPKKEEGESNEVGTIEEQKPVQKTPAEKK